MSRIDLAWSTYVLAFSFASSSVKGGLVLFLPEGSPIMAVKSPITKLAACPRSWKCLNFLRTTPCPICKSGRLGSQPSFIFKGFKVL